MRKEMKAHFGQTIVTESGPDRSSHQINANEALMGRSMKGSPTDVSHSLSGAGDVVTYNDKTKPGQKPPQQ
jgi:hypothetical protein